MNLALALIADRRLLAGATGAMAIVAGSFLPWSHTDVILGSLTEYGASTSGKVTFVLGLVALGLVLARASLPHADLAAGAGLAALAALGLTVSYRMSLARAGARVTSRLEFAGAFQARAGAGVWVVIAGSTVAAVSCLLLLRRSEEEVAPPEAG